MRIDPAPPRAGAAGLGPRHLSWIGLALLVAAGLGGCGGGDLERQAYAAWTGGLLDVTQPVLLLDTPRAETFSKQTVRQVMRVSLGGDRWRVRLSNLYGQQAATFSGVQLARSAGRSSIEAASGRLVTFHGEPKVTIAPGAEALSDAVTLRVAPLGEVALSLYFAAPTIMPTVHLTARPTAYVGDGDQLAAASMADDGAAQRGSYFGAGLIENLSSEPTRVIVAFGDSLTDTVAWTADGARRWPLQLDERLKAAGRGRSSVVNQGIAGNRWLRDGIGPSGSRRFERDVLGVPGVTHAIILLGINDLGMSLYAPEQEATAAQLIAAMAEAADKAKERGVQVLLGTLPPYKGAIYYSDAGEAKRQAVNAWIRSGAAGGFIDFDAVMRDRADPQRLSLAYDSGDRLHPSDAGYAAMAAAIDLARL